MKTREAKTKAGWQRRPERGFSMIELLAVMGVIIVVTAIAVVQLPSSLKNARSDNALRQMLDQLRQAREYAIAYRRFVQITFPVVGGSYQVQFTVMNTLTPGGQVANAVFPAISLPFPLQFQTFGTLPDTPDGFGNGAAVFFGGVNGGPPGGMYFRSDGELINATTNLPINGTVFMGAPGDVTTARAVTVLGTTGRVRGWRGSTGTAWSQF